MSTTYDWNAKDIPTQDEVFDKWAINWQPIDTAPKSGEPIIAWMRGECVIAEWMDAKWMGLELGMWVARDSHSMVSDKYNQPTHWRPLPPPPP